MKRWVISLGGSRIVPDEVDNKFLIDFKKLINSHPTHKFVAVTGGGTTARRYMSALKKLGKSNKEQSNTGIALTRFHAKYLMRLFGKKANHILPLNMKKVEAQLEKNQIVFCGALRYNPKQTSDGTAANIAAHLKCPFINLTNIQGLYTANPKTNKKAKFIKNITWKKFNTMAKKIKYQAGQHFVLDQSGAQIIEDKKVPTYIVGSLSDIDNILRGKRFKGTLIEG